jgi:hypothetical protein
MGDETLLQALNGSLVNDPAGPSTSEDDELLEAIILAGKDEDADLTMKYL